MTEDRIIQAALAMLNNKKNISQIAVDGDEFYFLYRKYVWSISLGENGHYLLYLYPKATTPWELFDGDGGFLRDSVYVKYDTREIDSFEARTVFKNLYLLLKELYFKSDEVLDDIINDGL